MKGRKRARGETDRKIGTEKEPAKKGTKIREGGRDRWLDTERRHGGRKKGKEDEKIRRDWRKVSGWWGGRRAIWDRVL